MDSLPTQTASLVEYYKARLPAAEAEAQGVRKKRRHICIFLCIASPLISVLAFVLAAQFSKNLPMTQTVALGVFGGILSLLGLYAFQLEKPNIDHVRPRIIIYLLLVVVLQSLVYLVFGANYSQKDVDLLYIMTVLWWQNTFFVGVVALSIVQSDFFNGYRTTKKIIPIEPDRAPTLFHCLSSILEKCQKSGMSLVLPVCWLARTDAFTMPTVTAVMAETGWTHHVLIPRKFMALLESKPEYGHAILAHEMAHIFQNDANLWCDTDVFFVLMCRTLVPYIALSWGIEAVTWAFTGEGLGNAAGYIIQLQILVMCLSAWSAAKAARTKSEMLADQFAAAICSRKVVAECVYEFASGRSSLHPDQDVRLAALGIDAQSSYRATTAADPAMRRRRVIRAAWMTAILGIALCVGGVIQVNYQNSIPYDNLAAEIIRILQSPDN